MPRPHPLSAFRTPADAGAPNPGADSDPSFSLTPTSNPSADPTALTSKSVPAHLTGSTSSTAVQAPPSFLNFGQATQVCPTIRSQSVTLWKQIFHFPFAPSNSLVTVTGSGVIFTALVTSLPFCPMTPTNCCSPGVLKLLLGASAPRMCPLLHPLRCLLL